jgi:hypothetical protein
LEIRKSLHSPIKSFLVQTSEALMDEESFQVASPEHALHHITEAKGKRKRWT